MRLYTVKKLFLLLGCVGFITGLSFADKKKKTQSQYEKPNIIKRAWGDLTTRNNYYFNANELYKELVYNYQFQRKYDYNKLLPFYYHDDADFSSYTTELETVAKKTGIVLQLHDYSRWRDNAYLLLGKSQFLRKQYDTSLVTFQYIVTTMKPGKMNYKLEFSNKDRLKYIRQRQKELAKQAGEKKKIIEFQYKKQQEEAKQKAEDAREKQQAAIDKKRKEIEEIIKAKKKIIELQKKGKKIPADLIAKAKGKSSALDSNVVKLNPNVKKTEKPNFDSKLPYVMMGDQYVKNPYYVDSTAKRDNQKPLDALTAKQEAKFDKLTFWEKIKHKPSRPEAIVWMSKTLIELGNYADAKSMISYGKSLRKLTKKQRREFYLIDAYYNIRRNDYSPAIEELENAMLYFKKKKEKAYYEYILAQLYEKNDQPADAVDYFVKAGKHTKTEELNLFAQIQLAKLYGHHPDLADQDIVKMLTKLIRFGKNKSHADEVLYTIANYYYFNKDTANTIAYLQKSISKSIDNKEQKGKSYLRLGEIYYDKEDYAQAAVYYDSAIVYLPNTIDGYDAIVSRKSTLTELAQNTKIIMMEDSLQRLGKMNPKDLEKFLAAVKAKQEKEDKKNSRFSSEASDNGSSAPAAFVPEDAISNGLWYFYNPESKSKGYNDFIRLWGDRKLEDNWRRSNKSAFFDDLPASGSNVDTVVTATAVKGKEKGKVTAAVSDSLAIPKSPEDFMRSDAKIANALFGNGELFKNKLNNLPKSKQAFDELTRRFPNSEYDAKAHYYQYLIYLDKNLQGLAEKEKQYILQNYPLSEVAEVLKNQGKNPSEDAERETSARLYASTYQSFLDGDYTQVIKNKFIAKTKYPSSFEMPQFEFLEAVSYGKTKQYDAYKRSLSDIITKYKEGDIKQKAQEYLIAYIQFESHINDTTAAPVAKVDTVPLPKDTISEKFVYDTTNIFVLLQLKEKYINVQAVVAKVNKFNKTKFDNFKIKVNPFFMDGFTLLQMKKFDGISDARNYYDALQINAPAIVGDNDLNKVDYFIIAPANFRLIKNQIDLDRYSRYYIENYLK